VSLLLLLLQINCQDWDLKAAHLVPAVRALLPLASFAMLLLNYNCCCC
jgi:hypothetical protein